MTDTKTVSQLYPALSIIFFFETNYIVLKVEKTVASLHTVSFLKEIVRLSLASRDKTRLKKKKN